MGEAGAHGSAHQKDGEQDRQPAAAVHTGGSSSAGRRGFGGAVVIGLQPHVLGTVMDQGDHDQGQHQGEGGFREKGEMQTEVLYDFVDDRG